MSSAVKLEWRFSRIRTEETNYGNMAADIMRSHYDADIALMNSGNIRNNVI